MNEKQKAKRKAEVISFIVEKVNMIDKSGEAGERYQKHLTAMTLEQFDGFINTLKNGDDILYVNIPNLSKKYVSVDNNLKVAKKWGVEFFQRLNIVDPISGKRYITPKKYAVLHLPVRRQIQTIKSGLAVATDASKIDPSTGQVVGDSKSASLSTPESFILYSKGLDKSIIEMAKMRGGDVTSQRYAYRKLHEQGFVNVSELSQIDSRAISTDTFSTYLKAMHIDNNL